MFVKAYLLFRDLRFDLRFAHHCRLLRQQAACRQPAAGGSTERGAGRQHVGALNAPLCSLDVAFPCFDDN